MKISSLVLAILLAVAAIPISAAVLHFKGSAIAIAEDKLALETEDGSILTLRVSATSRFLERGKAIKLGQLREGDHLDVDVNQDAKGSFIIVEARLLTRTQVDEEAGPPKLSRRPAGGTASSTPRATVRPSDPVPDRDTRPVGEGIRRELPTPDRSGAPEDSGAMGRRPTGDPKIELIERAREYAATFTEKLPNYVCTQYTTRYISESRPVNWHAQDTVSANVIYEDGRESYKNIAINGRPVNKKMEELEGSTSTGEFGTILLNLFHPATRTDFKFVKESPTSRMTTYLYDFSVQKPNSSWDIHVEGRDVKPAYHGSVWIDTSSGKVIRIEMEAQNMPEDFPIDLIQTAVDYDYVNLGTERYLLPTRSESISCQRSSSFCTRNVLDFRNYHRYTGESTITFEKP